MSRAVKPFVSDQSKLEAIRTGAKRKSDLGTNVSKGVIQGKGGKYIVVEKEKKFEEAGVKRKKRNYVLYESKLGTEKEKNLHKIEEAPQPKPKIIQKKKRLEYLDNYQYHETKNIKNPKKVSIVTHQRLGDIVGGVYEEHTYQRMSVNEQGKYSQETTKSTSRRGPQGQTTQRTTTTSRTVPAQSREYRREVNQNSNNTNLRNAPAGRATKTTTTVTRTGNRSNSRPAQTRTTTTTTTQTVTRGQSAGGSRRRH